MNYWHKQSGEPLFPDLLWSRPENRRHAGKLLIIGGNLHGFAAPATAYQEADQAGAGSIRILLPSALQKTVGTILEHGEFAPSTPSGSFARAALGDWQEHAAWADAVLLAGDLGRNSETAIAIEQFVRKHQGQLTITKDAVDYFYNAADALLNRPETTVVGTLAQVQKLARAVRFHPALSFEMGLVQTTEWLHQFTTTFSARLIMYHQQTLLTAVGGQISTTHVGEQETWRVKTAAHAAVWWMQNSSKPFEALTTGVYEIIPKPNSETKK